MKCTLLQITKPCFIGLLIFAAASSKATCYQVYRGQALVYHSQVPPVDLSLPYSETVPALFGPDASIVVVPGAFNCPSEAGVIPAAASPSGGGAQAPTSADPGAASSGQVDATVALTRLAQRYEGADDVEPGTGAPLVAGGYPGGYSAGGARFTHGPLQTGPRGGRYYINGSGGKTYVGRGGGGGGGGRSGRGRK